MRRRRLMMMHSGGKQAGSISYAVTSVSKTYGDSVFENALTIVGDGTVTYTSSNTSVATVNASGHVTIVGAGSATITATVADSATYEYAVKTASYSLSVAKASISPSVSMSGWTYGGTATNPSVSGNTGGGSVTYSYKLTSDPDTSYSSTKPSNAGNYTVRAVVAETANYLGATCNSTFAIAKANPTYTAPTAQSLTYSRSAQYLITTGSTSHGTIQYSSNGTSWSTTRPQGTNAGNYTSYWRLVGDSNHNDVASTSITTTIAKRTPVVNVSPSLVTGLTYTGSAQNLLSGGSMKHSSTSSTAVAGTFAYAQGTNAGTYSSLTWSFTPTDSTNYNPTSGTVSGSVTIAKASRTLSFSGSNYAIVAPSGTVTKTATPSAGSGDGAITYSIGSTTYATINSSTGAVTAKTTEGNTTVTATIAEGTNYLSATATYTLYVFSTVHNFEYTGSVQSITLPPGTFTLEVWGAQGGSNSANSTYSITAKAGGKGGYSKGDLTLSEGKTVYVFVGGQGGSSGNGGWNGGGGGSGSSVYNSGDTNGVSRMGCGGGATDIALVTSDMSYSSYRNNRTSASLLSRFIVAGGGAGGAMCYKGVTTSTTVTDRSVSSGLLTDSTYNGDSYSSNILTIAGGGSYSSNVLTLTDTHSSSSTSTSNDYQEGGVGGGTSGGGYSSTYQGGQSAAGTGGEFGKGANQTSTNYRYCSACGGGGWYGGGGGQKSDSSMPYCKYSGGGSGFVNTAANASYRPSGYTGLELDNGSTYSGTSSFPAPSGGTETGHSGNGYARITMDTGNYEFSYTGSTQSKTLKAGTYKIEAWGAQGGSYNTTYPGGKGGYSVGELTLASDTTVYIQVGGQGTNGTTAGSKAGGYNGGGKAYATSTTYLESAGGGASDVRIGQDSLYARVLVAGGGGGAGSYSSSYRYAGGVGGGATGGTPSEYSTSYKAGTGGTQTAKGDSYYGSTANSTTYGTLAAFGVGGGAGSSTSYQITGGGGGWYGGGYSRRGAGGGGSGYVYTSSTASNYPSGCLLNSNYYLANANTYAGNTSIPSTSGGTETGHAGNGYVKITKI